MGMYDKLPKTEKTTENRLGRKLRERDIEKYGGVVCKRNGWLFEKFVSPEKRGVPDRLISAREKEGENSLVFFIEFKKPYENATSIQKKDHNRRRAGRVMVFVVDCYEQMDEVEFIINSMLKNGFRYIHPQNLPARLLT